MTTLHFITSCELHLPEVYRLRRSALALMRSVAMWAVFPACLQLAAVAGLGPCSPEPAFVFSVPVSFEASTRQLASRSSHSFPNKPHGLFPTGLLVCLQRLHGDERSFMLLPSLAAVL